jgi:hypothetical protein
MVNTNFKQILLIKRGHKLSYYWIADEGNLENLNSDETVVYWKLPIKSNRSKFSIKVWVHDGHGLLSIAESIINAKSTNL